MLKEAQRVPRATYRLQLRREFPFAAVEAVAPHLRALGISDCYLSPILFSNPGSTHGYDVTDYRRIDPELGGREGLVRLHAALRQAGLGVLLDFVPNHMGINGPGPFNKWWQDVLGKGEASAYARYFDINWAPSTRSGLGGSGLGGTHSRVLVPILDDHYGRVLEAGRLSVVESGGGKLSIAYGEMRFPVSEETCEEICRGVACGARSGDGTPAANLTTIDAGAASDAPTWGGLAGRDGGAASDAPTRGGLVGRDAGAASDAPTRGGLVGRDAGAASDAPTRGGLVGRDAGAASDAPTGGGLAERLKELNGRPGEPRSFDELDRLIERQHYRLAYWKAGAHETNYRRFFAIDSLIGLRIEIPEVFDECHALLGMLLRDGLVTGVRVDHIDGLRDPASYLERLQALCNPRLDGTEAVPPVERVASLTLGATPFYVVVEKILGRGEELPQGWAAHGSTGYEFIAQVAGLMIDGRAEGEFTRLYADFTGSTATYASKIYEKKWMVLDEMFANAVAGLAEGLRKLPEADRRWRDLTAIELNSALREVIAQLSIYRTYRRGARPMGEFDRREVERACAEAARRTPRMGRQPFDFIRDVLVGNYPGPDLPPELREHAAQWTMTFQQYTGAVMAKAVEDTAFYTYCRFIGMNEVGCDPQDFGRPAASFHAANAARLRQAPHSLLATSTHDTKMGEDARARLYALSEIPVEWREWVAEWRGLNRRHKSLVDGESAPDANEEYRIYQVLLAAAPVHDTRDTGHGLKERIREYARKAGNEAKRHTAWANPNEAWLAAGDKFVDGMLDPELGREFLESFGPKARRLAHLGIVNSLAQLVLKILSPGVPDFYQGAEGWLLHLVDPDNRRLVDFAALQALSGRVDAPIGELLRDWQDGRIKWRVMRDLLRFRGENARLFQEGNYVPLEAVGAFPENVVGFRRGLGDGGSEMGDGGSEMEDRRSVIVVVPRLAAKLGCPPLGLVWEDTAVIGQSGVRSQESGAGNRPWRDVITGREFPGGGELPVRELFCELPFAVLSNLSEPRASA